MRKQKWLLLIVMMIAIIALPMTANAAAKLNKKKVTLSIGKTVQLKVTGTKAKVKWSSSNKKVVTVNSKGTAKGKKAGKAVITAKAGKKKLSCKITVKKKSSDASAITPQFNVSLLKLNLNTHPSDTIRLTNINAAQMKNVKIRIEKRAANVYSSNELPINKKVNYTVSGNAITVTAKYPGDFYLYASYGKKTERCRVAVDGFDELNSFICNGKNYDFHSCSQAVLGDLLCKAYPETYGLFRNQYISRCKTELAKILCIQKFYKDLNYQYKVTNLGQMHYFISNRIGQCQDYAMQTYYLCCVAGIPVETVRSSTLNHAWNQVYIGGSWCPLDTTSNYLIFNALSYNTVIPKDAEIRLGEEETGYKAIAREGYEFTVDGIEIDLSKCTVSVSSDGTIFQIYTQGELREYLRNAGEEYKFKYNLSADFVDGKLP